MVVLRMEFFLSTRDVALLQKHQEALDRLITQLGRGAHKQRTRKMQYANIGMAKVTTRLYGEEGRIDIYFDGDLQRMDDQMGHAHLVAKSGEIVYLRLRGGYIVYDRREYG
jgi:hypothetical protein